MDSKNSNKSDWTAKESQAVGQQAADEEGLEEQTTTSRQQMPLPENHYGLSFPTDHIDEFWSHSWRGDPFLKAFTLILHYNLAGAVVVGCLSALLAAFLGSQDILPDMLRGPMRGWSLLLGAISLAFTLEVWQSRTKVFLDKVCIDQCDMERKKQGVECIGAFLSRSRKMVVLWDKTYATRLWCVFEVATLVCL
jgi:hypothetical protein